MAGGGVCVKTVGTINESRKVRPELTYIHFVVHRVGRAPFFDLVRHRAEISGERRAARKENATVAGSSSRVPDNPLHGSENHIWPTLSVPGPETVCAGKKT